MLTVVHKQTWISFHLETHFGSTLWFNYLFHLLHGIRYGIRYLFCGDFGEGGLGSNDDIAGIIWYHDIICDVMLWYRVCDVMPWYRVCDVMSWYRVCDVMPWCHDIGYVMSCHDIGYVMSCHDIGYVMSCHDIGYVMMSCPCYWQVGISPHHAMIVLNQKIDYH